MNKTRIKWGMTVFFWHTTVVLNWVKGLKSMLLFLALNVVSKSKIFNKK